MAVGFDMTTCSMQANGPGSDRPGSAQVALQGFLLRFTSVMPTPAPFDIC